MQTLTIFKYEMLSSTRIFEERVSKHFVFSFLFGLLFTLVALFGAGIIIATITKIGGDVVELGTILLLFWTLIIARSVEYSQRALIKNTEIEGFLSLPIKIKPIVVAKFLVNLVQIFTIVFVGLLILFIVTSLINVFIFTYDIILEIILIILLGTFLGFTIPIFVNIKPLKTKLIAIYSLSPLFLISYILFTETNLIIRPFSFFHLSILFILTIVAGIIFYYSDKFLLNARIVIYKKEETKERLTFLDKLPINRKVLTIAKKELITLIREKEAFGTILASAFLIFIPIFSHFFIKVDFGVYQYYSMPFILVTCVFLSAILQNTMLGLAIVSIEGKKLWLLKSLPISSKKVIRGKALALLILSFPTTIAIALTYPIIANYKLTTILFFLIIALILWLSFTGIGILLGNLIPNFDESVKGTPDFTSQFISSFICLIVATIIIGIPSYILVIDKSGYNFGLIAILISLVLAILIYYLGIDVASHLYNKIDIESYG